MTMEMTETGLDGAVFLGTVEKVDADGTPWVRLARRRPLRAQTTTTAPPAALQKALADRTPVVVALVGSPAQAVVLGILAPAPAEPAVEARVDGTKVTVTGEEEVTLRCGKASITLTRAGKILIRGEYVLTRSSGVNRIKGGAVQIN